MTPPPRAFVFDLDGALLDTRRLVAECCRRALAPYLYCEPDDAEIAERRAASGGRFVAEWIGERYAAECLAAVDRHYAAPYASFSDGAYEGVREMLDALRSAGCVLAIVTERGRAAWQSAARDLAPEAFAAVVTADDLAAPGTEVDADADRLLAAVETVGVGAESCVHVCGGVSGLAAGRAAGMRVAAALWPHPTGLRERFVNDAAAGRPEWMPERPADLTRAFAAWC